MRSTITKYAVAFNMTPMSTVSLNRIGAVNNTGISCSSMFLNPFAGEFVQSISFAWDN
jgi:hypothetical protein